MYKWIVAQEKSLYHSLNNMRSGQKIYIGFFWTPVSQSASVAQSLRAYTTTRFEPVDPSTYTIKPPTYFQ